MTTTTKTFLAAFLAAASVLRAQAAPPALDPAQAGCAAREMQLFYYYLEPAKDGAQERTVACGGAERSVKMPDWLQAAAPAMRERLVWDDPDEGRLSEAALWQAPVSILYELAATNQKTLPGAAEGASPFALEKEYNGIRQRFILSLDRLDRAKLGGSFGGRGEGLLSTMNRIMEQLDLLTDALYMRKLDGFNESAGKTARLSDELFAQLFAAPGPKEKFRYIPDPRILPGYRGVSLPVAGVQTLFLKRGDRVDLLVTFEAVMKGDVREMVTATILQNVIVLNVARSEAPDGAGVVQLLCNPNEAQYASLSLAQSKRINITRRAPGDVKMEPMEMASFKRLFK